MNGGMSGGRDSREQDCAFRETVSAQALQQRFCHHPQRPVELNVGIDAVNGPGMDTFSSGTAWLSLRQKRRRIVSRRSFTT